jgi:hypothetical protein
MSVASMAGYLANGGGQSTYKTVTIGDQTPLTMVNTSTILFNIGEIIQPAGVYIVNTFIYLQSYNAEDNEAGVINSSQVIVGYIPVDGDQKFINNQIYIGTESQVFIQTSGIFVSDGTGSLVVTANVLTASDGATQYNVKIAPNISPIVQLVKIA